MDFQPSEDQRLVQRTAHDFAERVLVPKAAERDQSGAFSESEILRIVIARGLIRA